MIVDSLKYGVFYGLIFLIPCFFWWLCQIASEYFQEANKCKSYTQDENLKSIVRVDAGIRPKIIPYFKSVWMPLTASVIVSFVGFILNIVMEISK